MHHFRYFVLALQQKKPLPLCIPLRIQQHNSNKKIIKISYNYSNKCGNNHSTVNIMPILCSKHKVSVFWDFSSFVDDKMKKKKKEINAKREEKINNNRKIQMFRKQKNRGQNPTHKWIKHLNIMIIFWRNKENEKLHFLSLGNFMDSFSFITQKQHKIYFLILLYALINKSMHYNNNNKKRKKGIEWI